MRSGGVGVQGVKTSIFQDDKLAENESLIKLLADLDKQQEAAGYYRDKSKAANHFTAAACTSVIIGVVIISLLFFGTKTIQAVMFAL